MESCLLLVLGDAYMAIRNVEVLGCHNFQWLAGNHAQLGEGLVSRRVLYAHPDGKEEAGLYQSLMCWLHSGSHLWDL